MRAHVGMLLPACLVLFQVSVTGGFIAAQRPRCNICHRYVNLARLSVLCDDSDNNECEWMKRGLLISSFHDGVLNNPPAQEFLMDSLLITLWGDRLHRAEQAVYESSLQSPCCGPNISALEALEEMDRTMAQKKLPPNAELRFVYIPTAMYAIRRDSQNTPGKQRQRARADAKQRRTSIVQFLQERLGEQTRILSVTLDLDDGSIKQSEGSSDLTGFPLNGVDALQKWAPHLIYVEGGNTFWLHYCMHKGGWDSILRRACRTSVYCGKSAGAILAGESLETACWKGWDDPSIIPEMPNYSNWKNVHGLGLVGKMSFFPHMAEEWEDRVESRRRELGNVCLLTDQQACCVDGMAKLVSVCEASTTRVMFLMK